MGMLYCLEIPVMEKVYCVSFLETAGHQLNLGRKAEMNLSHTETYPCTSLSENTIGKCMVVS